MRGVLLFGVLVFSRMATAGAEEEVFHIGDPDIARVRQAGESPRPSIGELPVNRTALRRGNRQWPQSQ